MLSWGYKLVGARASAHPSRAKTVGIVARLSEQLFHLCRVEHPIAHQERREDESTLLPDVSALWRH